MTPTELCWYYETSNATRSWGDISLEDINICPDFTSHNALSIQTLMQWIKGIKCMLPQYLWIKYALTMLQPEINGTHSHFSEPQSSQGTFSPSLSFKACPEDCTIASTSSPQCTFTKNLHKLHEHHPNWKTKEQDHQDHKETASHHLSTGDLSPNMNRLQYWSMF